VAALPARPSLTEAVHRPPERWLFQVDVGRSHIDRHLVDLDAQLVLDYIGVPLAAFFRLYHNLDVARFRLFWLAVGEKNGSCRGSFSCHQRLGFRDPILHVDLWVDQAHTHIGLFLGVIPISSCRDVDAV